MNRKFKVGDKVTAKLEFGTFKGKIVYVDHYENKPYLVQFKKENSRFHSGELSGECHKEDHCYWCKEDKLVARTRDTDFHIGDKVKIRSWKSMEKEYGLNMFGSIDMPHRFVDSMKPLCGCTATILSITTGGRVGLEFDNADDLNTSWAFGVEMLKKVKDKEKVFEDGKTYKFYRKLFVKDFIGVGDKWTYECDGEVVSVLTKNSGKIGPYGVSRDWCVECEPEETEEPKLYTGKVVCVDLCGLNHGVYTVGKIYQLENGMITTDIGSRLTGFHGGFKSFEEFDNFSKSKFIEVVE